MVRKRSQERLRRHYEVEKALADRLRGTRSREERARLYASIYDTLFAAVPDHPRLTEFRELASIDKTNRGRLATVAPYLHGHSTVLEIGVGDCAFAPELARRARAVIGVDVSDRGEPLDLPDNFQMVIYDGFHLPVVPRSFDLAFSDQVIEHLHVDDIEVHFKMIAEALRPGGYYVFRTPHRFSGPHDVSRYFTDGDPQGFHMKEWTYAELREVLRRAGYGKLTAVWQAKGVAVRMPVWMMVLNEFSLKLYPKAIRRKAAWLPFPHLVIAARKA